MNKERKGSSYFQRFMFGRDGRHKDSLVTVNRKYPSPETSNANGYTLQEQHWSSRRKGEKTKLKVGKKPPLPR